MRQVRSMRCGHDRYFRGYLILPGQSDVYVEGLDHDPLSSTIKTHVTYSEQASGQVSAGNSVTSTPVSHSAWQVSHVAPSSSLLATTEVLCSFFQAMGIATMWLQYFTCHNKNDLILIVLFYSSDVSFTWV